MFSTKKFWATVLSSWLLFIGLDFLFHASLLKGLWQEEVVSFRPESELFALIPVGYASFLLLVLLIGFVFASLFRNPPELMQSMVFAVLFGGLYAVGNILGLYSYLNIPLKYIILFQLVYFIEIQFVVYIFYKATRMEKMRSILNLGIISFMGLVLLGIILQNIL